MMKGMRGRLAAGLATAAIVTGAGWALPAMAQSDQLTVAYFLEWPLPALAAKADGSFDKALGAPVKWVSFDTGTAMSAAMASGDVQIALGQGMPPFVVATSAGQPLQMLDVAVSYSDNDNCVVSNNLEIDKTNAKELAGKKAAVPLGTAAHYGFLKQMEHFGVDPGSINVVDMAPAEGAAALAQGSVDMACGFGAGLTRMKQYGHVLLTGKEKEDLGILVFDGISAPADYVAEHPETVAKFLAVVDQANHKWTSGQGGDEMLNAMAKESGMDPQATKDFVATTSFPTIDEKLSERWLGGAVQKLMKGVGDTFVAAGSIPKALDSYDAVVNVEPMKAAKALEQ